MYSINFSWPEKSINATIDSENSWSFRDAFRILKLNEAVVADCFPPIDTDLGVFRSIMVSDITVDYQFYELQNICSFFGHSESHR